MNLWAQEGLKAVVTKPAKGELFRWAKSSPSITIQASLQQKGEPVTTNENVKRLFLTAQVFVDDRLTDIVPLWGDGAHSDEKAREGVFTTLYRPNQTGAFKVRIRAQADLVQDGKVVVKDFWSSFVPFQVLPIPYPHIISPEPRAKTGTKIHIRARLLLQNKPFEEQDESLQTIAVAKFSEKLATQTILKRTGLLVIGSLDMPKLGTYQVTVSVSVISQGKKLSVESEPIEIQVSRPPLTLLILSVLLFIIHLLLPPKEPPLQYRHYVRIGQTKVELNPGQEKPVNGIIVKGAADRNVVTVVITVITMKQGEEK